MEQNVKQIQEERTQIFKDVFDSIIPKRVPINFFVSTEFAAQMAGVNVMEAQWNPEIMGQAAEKVCETIYSDSVPYLPNLRAINAYTFLESQSFVMGSTGFIQHPEVSGLLPSEYDELIEDPWKCIMEKVLPRQCKALDPSNTINAMLHLTKGVMAKNQADMNGGMVMMGLIDKFGYRTMSMNSGASEAPFDYVADQLRGFTGISKDIRRMPEKTAKAAEAVYPIVKKLGMPMMIDDYSYVMYPLHMPTFMREKDFAKYWWPSYKALCEDFASMGVRTAAFCEDDWMRYLDYLAELPVNSHLTFEYGDAKLIKKKLGNRHIISGLYPIGYLKTHTKQECIDLAKEYIDTLAPGGKYIFTFDKIPLAYSDVNIENLNAVLETVRDYGVYSNPGEQVGEVFHKKDYEVPLHREDIGSYYQSPIDTTKKYSNVPESGLMKLQGVEEQLFSFLANLLM